MTRRRGVLRVGTSGFGYPGWIPAFYPPGTRPDSFLELYARRLDACELNGTYYRRPSPSVVARWRSATPDSFRFSVKAHHAGSRRAFADPAAVSWLVAPMAAFGEQLGCVLYRLPEDVERDDDRLAALLAAWPAALPLTVEFRNPSWLVDEVFELLRPAGAVLCATEQPEDPEPPRLHVTGEFLYVRLRRNDYEPEELDAWAERLEPFLADGRDVYAFFRHDPVGQGPHRALELATRLPTP